MNREDINNFNILARKLCNELKPENKCAYCPFHQWDTYYNCFDEDMCEYPLYEEKSNDSNR